MAEQSTALQLYTGNEQERLKLLAEYKPHDHLVSWAAFDKRKNQNVTVIYYPAAWRLYELNLKYPFANFSSEIVHMEPEKNFVVIRARLYLGPSYEESPKKAEAYKQGLLSELDKVETRAKARAARDFGIGTERALDMDDAEADAVAGDTPSANGNPRKVIEADTPASNGHKEQSARPADPTGGPAPSGEDFNTPATDQQKTSILKLAHMLKRDVNEPVTYLEAKALIAELSEDYRKSRKAS